jgi:hypothetical protein
LVTEDRVHPSGAPTGELVHHRCGRARGQSRGLAIYFAAVLRRRA